MLNFFLCELPLILAVSLKWKKKREWRYLQGALDIELGRDWSVGLGAPLGDGHRDFFFLVSGIFAGKADSIILLGFERTISL